MQTSLKTSLKMAAILSAMACATPLGAVELCHIANAGFLIKGQNASVLVDGLMVEDHYDGRFALPTDATVQSMMERTGDFSALKLVLSTHRHGDHFDPKATMRHLRANPNVHYVYPTDTLATLKANGLTPDEEHRITAVPAGPPQNYMFDGISVESFSIDHGKNMPQNVGYRITLDNSSIFFTGDISASRDSLKASGLNALQTDVLVMPYWYGMNDTEQRTAMRESWSYKTIIPTHFQTGAPWMERYGGPDGLKATVRDSMPNTMIIADANQCTTLPAS